MSPQAEKRFIEAWRYAAPRLEEIRCAELRELDEAAGLKMIGGGEPSEDERLDSALTSGLAHFQGWMMRLRVMQLQAQLQVQIDQHEKADVGRE